MSRLTGLVKPKPAYKIQSALCKTRYITIPAVDQQCPACKRYFKDVKRHQKSATACKVIRGVTK